MLCGTRVVLRFSVSLGEKKLKDILSWKKLVCILNLKEKNFPPESWFLCSSNSRVQESSFLQCPEWLGPPPPGLLFKRQRIAFTRQGSMHLSY